MAFLLAKKFDKTINSTVYAYDLDRETYFGHRYVVTLGLNLEGCSIDEALTKLFEFKGEIHRVMDKKQALKMIDGRRR